MVIYTTKIYRTSISKFKSLFPSIIQIFCIFILKKNYGYYHFKIFCKVNLLGSSIFSWFANQAYSDGLLSQTCNSKYCQLIVIRYYKSKNIYSLIIWHLSRACWYSKYPLYETVLLSTHSLHMYK